MIKQLQEHGHAQEDAEKIATKKLQQAGKLQPGTMRLTEIGKEESKLDWNTRRIMREANKRGLPDFYFHMVNGKVRIKPEYSKRRFYK